MAQTYHILLSPSSTFHDTISTSISHSSCSPNFKVLSFPPSPIKFPSRPQSKTSLRVSSQDHLPQPTQQHSSPPESSHPHDPDAKLRPLSQKRIWVNPRNPRAKHLLKKSNASSARSSPPLLRVAKSLDCCDEQDVPKILNSLGDKVIQRSAVFVLDNVLNPKIALVALNYLQPKVKPTKHVVLYNVTLKLYREVKDFEGAEKLFDEMILREVKPNVITFGTMISCASMCSFPHKAVELFEKMPSFGCEPDDSISSSMIYAYARTGNVSMALSLYERAKSEKWHIDIVAFSALIKMHGMSEKYDECLNIYNDMKVLDAKPNLVTYNTLLYAMGRAKKARQAKIIYEEMVNNGFLPSGATYAALLQAYCRGRFSEDALSVYKEMKEKGKKMDVVLYNMLLAMCADVGCTDEAVEIFEDMKSSATFQPDSFTFSSLINMYSRIGKVSEAEAVLNEMITCGIKPDIYVLTSFVQCYGKANRTDDVVKIFNQCLDFGVIPDVRVSDCLLTVMAQTPKEELGKLTDCVEKANPQLGSVARCLLEEQGGDGDFRREASELFNSISADVKKSFCNCLIDLCLNINLPDRASDLLELGLKLEIYPEIQSRSETKWYLHLKRLSLGAALTALRFWISDLSKVLESGEDLPPVLGINTAGFGKQKSFSDKDFASLFELHLKELNAPFHEAADKGGWFFTTNTEVKSWLQSRDSIAVQNSKVLGVPRMALHH